MSSSSSSPNLNPSLENQRAHLHSVLDSKGKAITTKWGGRCVVWLDSNDSKAGSHDYTLSELARAVDRLDKEYYLSPDKPLAEHLKEREAFATRIRTLEGELDGKKATWNVFQRGLWHLRHLFGRIGCNREALLNRFSSVSENELKKTLDVVLKEQKVMRGLFSGSVTPLRSDMNIRVDSNRLGSGSLVINLIRCTKQPEGNQPSFLQYSVVINDSSGRNYSFRTREIARGDDDHIMWTKNQRKAYPPLSMEDYNGLIQLLQRTIIPSAT